MNVPDAELELDHPTEIAALLEELAQSHRPLHVQGASGGALSLQALLLERTAQQLWLRLPGLGPQTPAWLLDEPLRLSAVLGKVQVEFQDSGPRQVADQGGLPALALHLPTRMRRVQRRQAFRVAPVSHHPPRATLPQAGAQPMRMGTQDLSASGVALIWPRADAPPALDQRLDGVELELERGLRISVSLRVQHTRLNDQGEWVVGCVFLPLPAPSERQLLSHLNQLQRRHRVLKR